MKKRISDLFPPLIEQNLTSNSPLNVPSVAAVKGALGATGTAYEVRRAGGVVDYKPYDTTKYLSGLVNDFTDSNNAGTSIIAHIQATIDMAYSCFYPSEFYAFNSTFQTNGPYQVDLCAQHVIIYSTWLVPDDGLFFTDNYDVKNGSRVSMTLRRATIKPAPGGSQAQLLLLGVTDLYLIDCDLQDTYPGVIDTGKVYLLGNTTVPADYVPDGVTVIDKRSNTVFANTTALFPPTGNVNKLYVASRANKIYRWTGTAYVELAAPSIVQTTGNNGTAVMSQAATTTALGLVKIGNTTTGSLATPDNSGIFLTMTSSTALEFTIYVEANMSTVVGNHYYIRQGGAGQINIVPRQVNGLSYPAPTLTAIGCNTSTNGMNSILHLVKVGPGDNWIVMPANGSLTVNTFTPVSLRSDVVNAGTFYQGEMSSTPPAGSTPGMKFSTGNGTDNYVYEYMLSSSDSNGTKYTWVRTVRK